jgi:phosphoglycolate phosphatase
MQRLLKHLLDKDHVIWDWNGTLLSDVEHAVATINGLLTPRGLAPLNIERYRKTFCFPIRKYYESLGFDLESESFPDLCAAFVDAFMAKVVDCPLMPGSRELLQSVKRAGKTQSILSATDQANLQWMVRTFELEPYFNFVFGIEDKLAASKIHRGHELMRMSGVAPERTILVGDTDHDFEVAQALGIAVVLVAHGHQSADRLRHIHHHVVDVAGGA